MENMGTSIRVMWDPLGPRNPYLWLLVPQKA